MQAAMTFSEALASDRTLLADGATGTILQAVGLPVGEAPERWTRDQPKAIRGSGAPVRGGHTVLVLSHQQLRRLAFWIEPGEPAVPENVGRLDGVLRGRIAISARHDRW